jgi:hypothetical protein
VRQQPPEVGPQSLAPPSRSPRCVPIHPTPRSGLLTRRRSPSYPTHPLNPRGELWGPRGGRYRGMQPPRPLLNPFAADGARSR